MDPREVGATSIAIGSRKVKKLRAEQGHLTLVIRKCLMCMRTVTVNDSVEGKFIKL